jgi:hypothetical protein
VAATCRGAYFRFKSIGTAMQLKYQGIEMLHFLWDFYGIFMEFLWNVMV